MEEVLDISVWSTGIEIACTHKSAYTLNPLLFIAPLASFSHIHGTPQYWILLRI